MRTDAKNLATTARTIHLAELKGTIHMIYMLRKEALLTFQLRIAWQIA